MNTVARSDHDAAGDGRHLPVVGERAGEYLIEEELPDGRLVIRADTSAEAMNRRMGLTRIPSADFEAWIAEHGDQLLPRDDEG